MFYTPSDAATRHEFIDRTVEGALEAFTGPHVQNSLGSLGKLLLKSTENIVVPNINGDGVVQLPEGFDTDSDLLPITAIFPGEELMLANGYAAFSPTQAKRATQQFEAWKPTSLKPDDLFDALFARARFDDSHGSMPRFSGVGSTASIIAVSGWFKLNKIGFEQPPSGDLVRMRLQPLMKLSMIPGTKRTEPDVFGHELVHVKQRTENPLGVFGSQKAFEKASLRDELEAYHVGGLVRRGVLNALGIDMRTVDLDDMDNIQLAVEVVRMSEKAEDDPYPFIATPALKAKLAEYFGLERILHDNTFDYDKFQELLPALGFAEDIA